MKALTGGKLFVREADNIFVYNCDFDKYRKLQNRGRKGKKIAYRQFKI